ncbi:MAG: type I restriction enzyme HsdR N-terminal domain-containing protein [Patescibacteria group bacterium]|nr:type I restriction enzyme HsdR N-terminal domain-containing protein [Patescibacteria group bacterium]
MLGAIFRFIFKRQDNIYAIFEVKRRGASLHSAKSQLLSYLIATNAEYGVCTNMNQSIIFKRTGSHPLYAEVSEFPPIAPVVS